MGNFSSEIFEELQNMKKISLCVPSYNRPETLRQLINSFLKQNYPNKELIISDDTPDKSIENLIKSYRSKSIKYFHNNIGLGFSKNLLKAMERATGEYIIILGDDDLLADEFVFSDYVNIFDSYPNVGFIYSNQIQFSNSLKTEYIINFYNQSKLFKKGNESMKNLLIRSIFIGGIGVRNSSKLKSYYPLKKILHPQVEFIGNIINLYDSYLIAKNHIGFRSHEDQIIFRALKNKKIRQAGKHMTLELFDIFNYLNKKYKLNLDFDFVAKELINQQFIIMFKEKSILGNGEMEKNYKNFCKISYLAKTSNKLKIAYFLSRILPSKIIIKLRYLILLIPRLLNIRVYHKNDRQLLKMISE